MPLNFILLDGAQGLILIPIFFLAHVISTLLIEGTILYFFKYKTFKKSLWDAFLVNLCSLVIGLLLLSPFNAIAQSPRVANMIGDNYVLEMLTVLGLFFVQTIIVEGVMLRLFNKSFPMGRLIAATLIMNLITYTTLYFIVIHN